MFKKDSSIDNAIDSGNYKVALKLLNKKIEQNSNSYLKAQKCQVLQLDGQIQESIQYCNEVVSQTPSDPEAIELLLEVYESLEVTPDEDIFEKAAKKYPTLALIYRWFTYCVKTNDLIGLQKSTTALTKAVSGNSNIKNTRLFKMWSCYAMLINVQLCPQDLKPASLKLFPMLALKLIESQDPVTSQEVFLYIHALKLNGKNQEACDKLSAFLTKENDLELKILYFELLQDVQDYETLFAISSRYLVELQEDDWDTWKLLIKSAFKTEKVDQLFEIIKNYKIGRNSQLAYLEIYSFYQVDTKLFFEYVAKYLDHYGHKLCCPLDLKIFSPVLNDHKEKMISILNEKYQKMQIDNVLNNSLRPTEKELIFMVNYIKLKVYLNQNLLQSPSLINDCLKYYNSTKALLNKKEDTEYFPGSEFIILAVQCLLLQAETIDAELIIKCIVLLENAMVKDQHEFHIRLWLIDLYKRLNCYSLSVEYYHFLKIKILQTDTLSSYVTSKSSYQTTDTSIVHTSLGFYLNQVPENCSSSTIEAFSRSTFNKLQGFLEFSQRLENSFAKYMNILEYLQMSRIVDDQSTVEYLTPYLIKCWNLITKSKIEDNRDFKTFWDCGIHERIPQITQKLDEFCDVSKYDNNYLQYRTLKELVVYQNSRLIQDQIQQFAQLNFDELLLSPIGKWQYSTIVSIIDETKKVQTLTTTPLPSSTLSSLSYAKSEYYMTLADTHRIVQLFIRESKQRNLTKEKLNGLKKLSIELSQALRSFRDGGLVEIRNEGMKELIQYEQNINAWLEKDKDVFNVDSKVVDSVFDKIRQSVNQSLNTLRKI